MVWIVLSSCHTFLQIQEADLLQVAAVMGLEEKVDATDDIGAADAILASSYEMKQNPWIRGVAKFHQLPVFVIKVCRNQLFHRAENIRSDARRYLLRMKDFIR